MSFTWRPVSQKITSWSGICFVLSSLPSVSALDHCPHLASCELREVCGFSLLFDMTSYSPLSSSDSRLPLGILACTAFSPRTVCIHPPSRAKLPTQHQLHCVTRARRVFRTQLRPHGCIAVTVENSVVRRAGEVPGGRDCRSLSAFSESVMQRVYR